MPLHWHAVEAPLSAYVRFLYHWEGPMPRVRHTILPLPSTDLKFSFGDPLRAYDPNTGSGAVCDGSWCMGIWDHRHVVEWPANARFVGVRFRPGGAHAFLGIPLSELHNRIVTLSDILGSVAPSMAEQLFDARTAEERFALVEALLLARLSERPPSSRLVGHVAARIASSRGAARIGRLCEEVGVSHKHLITLFRQTVGCTPKELARLHRFAHVLESIDPTQPMDWTSVAQDHDYFDQSHFIHDFTAYAGLGPSAYLKMRRGYAEDSVPTATLGVTPAG